MKVTDDFLVTDFRGRLPISALNPTVAFETIDYFVLKTVMNKTVFPFSWCLSHFLVCFSYPSLTYNASVEIFSHSLHTPSQPHGLSYYLQMGGVSLTCRKRYVSSLQPCFCVVCVSPCVPLGSFILPCSRRKCSFFLYPAAWSGNHLYLQAEACSYLPFLLFTPRSVSQVLAF